MTASERLLAAIEAGVIGNDAAFTGPYGPRRVTYTDYTASGQSLDFLEDFVRRAVLPLYANTHTEASSTGRQTTRLREEARALVASSVGAGPEHAVIFCGSGSTAAIDKLVGILNLRIPRDLDRQFDLSRAIPPEQRPVVFVGPYEHHSNELPWRESIAEVVAIREDDAGRIDAAHLAEELEAHAGRRLIASFSAASNVTGIISETEELSELLHAHGALAFWDFAAAAPYLEIHMGTGADAWRKDAVFISAHKFVGGPGTPGVLVVRRELMRNSVPVVVGGGTVAYVNQREHEYVSDPVEREEGGTPEIVGAIRAGLVFRLKDEVGPETIRAHEQRLVRRAFDAWLGDESLLILGNTETRRLATISLNVRVGERFLHHNLVVALLNDLFGIQSRGGCSCAGPYGHRLLGIGIEASHDYWHLVEQGYHGIKPGWVRISFPYFASDETIEFVLAAVKRLSGLGSILVDDYEFDPLSGRWLNARDVPPAYSLGDVDFSHGAFAWREPAAVAAEPDRGRYLELADEIAAGVAKRATPPSRIAVPPAFEALRWFVLPGEGS